MFKKMIIGLFIYIFTTFIFAKEIKVGLEKFPPLIESSKKGYTINILKEIEKISDFKFKIIVMPYNRARYELEAGNVDIIGHTPYKLETKEFYSYAQELDFKIDLKTAIFVKDKNKLKDITKLKIGIPRGNEKFASALLGIPIEKFHLGSLANLLKMLEAKRIDAFWFEKSSTINTLKKLKIKNVFYKDLPKNMVPASLAVNKDKKGKVLRKKLESLIKKINIKELLKSYTNYLNMPNEGVIK